MAISRDSAASYPQPRVTSFFEKFLQSTHRSFGAIRGEKDVRDGQVGYWLWFDDYLLEEFEKQTGKSYVDETFISKELIRN